MADIILVEDDKEIGTLLCDFLSDKYKVKLFESGEKALEYFDKNGAELVILDVMLPGIDGMAVCRHIRETNHTPILMVSAKNRKEDKLNGLLSGADDYIEKPYDIDILLAKVANIFRRRNFSQTITDGNITVDKSRRVILKDGNPLTMTQKEYELFVLLIENSGKTLNKDMIFNKIWGNDSFSEPQTLTVHIKWLRQKTEDDPKKPERIITVWGVGYRYERKEKNS